MSNKIQPKPLEKVTCPKCGELQIKIYPYSSIRMKEGSQIPPCQKCLNIGK